MLINKQLIMVWPWLELHMKLSLISYFTLFDYLIKTVSCFDKGFFSLGTINQVGGMDDKKEGRRQRGRK
jgi:hypothetical protein